MHGGFPTLKKLLEMKVIDEKDFLCEGWGCVFHDTEDFAHDEYDNPILEKDFPDIECEFFEPRANREELAKRIFSFTAWKEKGYPHMDISHVEVSNDEEKKE